MSRNLASSSFRSMSPPPSSMYQQRSPMHSPPPSSAPTAIAAKSNHNNASGNLSSKLVDDPSLRAGNAETAGIGLIFVEGLDSSRSIAVMTFVRNGPAERDGTIKIGDVIAQVDGYSVEKEALNVVRQLILGPPGTPVNLAFRRAGQANLIQVRLIREKADDNKNIEQRLIQEMNQLRERHRREISTMETTHNDTVRDLQAILRESEGKVSQLERELSRRLNQMDELNDLLQAEKRTRELLQQQLEKLEDAMRSQTDARNVTAVDMESMQIRIQTLESEIRRLQEELMRSRNMIQQYQQQEQQRPRSPPPQQQQQQPQQPPPEERVIVIENTQAISGSAGVGLILDDDPNMEKFKVHMLVRGSAAAANGMIKEGDYVIGVDKYSVAGRPLSVVKDYIKGPVGTTVTLHLTRNFTGERYTVSLVRGRELQTETRRFIRESSPPPERRYPSGLFSTYTPSSASAASISPTRRNPYASEYDNYNGRYDLNTSEGSRSSALSNNDPRQQQIRL